MGVKERKEREKEELRQKIMDAAEELIVKDGYEKLSVKRIADKIEYSPTTIYLYFKDKSDLVYSLIKARFDRFGAALEKAYAGVSDPVDKIRLGLKVFIERGLENPNFYLAIFLNDLEHLENAGILVNEGYARSEGFIILRDSVQEAVDNGTFKALDVNLTAMSLWSSAIGLMIMLINQNQFSDAQKKDSIENLLNILIEGMKK